MRRPEHPDAKTRQVMRHLHAMRVKLLATPPATDQQPAQTKEDASVPDQETAGVR